MKAISFLFVFQFLFLISSHAKGYCFLNQEFSTIPLYDLDTEQKKELAFNYAQEHCAFTKEENGMGKVILINYWVVKQKNIDNPHLSRPGIVKYILCLKTEETFFYIPKFELKCMENEMRFED